MLYIKNNAIGFDFMATRVSAIIICLFCNLALAYSYDCKINGIYYNLYENEAEVTYSKKYINSYKKNIVEVPAYIKYKGKTFHVTSIGNAAFCKCSQIISVKLPETIVRIGRFAFYDCDSLKELTIPNKVKEIGEKAFCSSGSLRKVVLPDSLMILRNGAFAFCEMLSEINFPTNLKCIEKEAYYMTSIRKVVLPEGLLKIEESAFASCNRLEYILLPSSINSIAKDIFWMTTNLKVVDSNIENPNCILPSYIQYPFTMDFSNCTLYVPIGTKKRYMEVDSWNSFGRIIEKEEALFENIYPS